MPSKVFFWSENGSWKMFCSATLKVWPDTPYEASFVWFIFCRGLKSIRHQVLKIWSLKVIFPSYGLFNFFDPNKGSESTLQEAKHRDKKHWVVFYAEKDDLKIKIELNGDNSNGNDSVCFPDEILEFQSVGFVLRVIRMFGCFCRFFDWFFSNWLFGSSYLSRTGSVLFAKKTKSDSDFVVQSKLYYGFTWLSICILNMKIYGANDITNIPRTHFFSPDTRNKTKYIIFFSFHNIMLYIIHFFIHVLIILCLILTLSICLFIFPDWYSGFLWVSVRYFLKHIKIQVLK